MPQITPFARAALIEFLVLSLFTGQMSKLPPHGTSPAGPARAPGGQRVPLGRAAAVPPSRTGLVAEPSLTPAPPRTGPAQPPPLGSEPGPGPTGGGRGNFGAGTWGGVVPAPPAGSLPRSAALPGALRRPGRLSSPVIPRLWPASGGRSPCNL